ncbi:MAG TPA: virulence RhuM family protein [Thiobacillus sp.]|nr:MAG: hydroxyacid dehydrogenase [Hydrogenophilales bacterium 28-61-11]OYZ58531.1 MAG: hydroxyacid dehydrogenase [Hydrogenophilales bacterium 16-61-112]OZA50444.1 MAG: hydroxyacid dehydrogenase [Hydrogenophilales bacterium 17-61-76]HQT29624.1 virulence RhuM family protein [Thiobacillus sp.]HQT70240.1 virulence RhuM family protein [Thiobacillus sp.]
MSDEPLPQSEIILYQTEDGRTRVQCRFEDETLWLTQAQISELFQTTPQNVTLHLKAIFAEGELVEAATCKDYLQVRLEGGREVSRKLRHYRLEAVLAVGFRVRSQRGTQFRQWATARLSEYLVKGFTMDDERLKNPPGKGQKDYFDELLERIRDIRSSERRFYQKVLDIYATSVDYTPDAETSHRFFAAVQNKMHWATHGHTAAEVIAERADAAKPFMGLQTTRPGGIVRKDDVAVAKNYLTQDELQVLNRIVNLYIEYAELQALERKPMTMRDWITKLDEFLKISGRELLDHAGKVSADDARAKAELEYFRYRALLDAQPQRVDADFEKAAQELKKLSRPKKPKTPKP